MSDEVIEDPSLDKRASENPHSIESSSEAEDFRAYESESLETEGQQKKETQYDQKDSALGIAAKGKAPNEGYSSNQLNQAASDRENVHPLLVETGMKDSSQIFAILRHYFLNSICSCGPFVYDRRRYEFGHQANHSLHAQQLEVLLKRRK